MAKHRKEESREKARRARGGKAGPGEKLYNAAGSPAAKSAEDDKDDGFRRGGHVRKERKEGGKVEGEREEVRMDKRARGGPARSASGQFARGGHVKMARGGSPYSAAHSAKEIGADDGHQGRMPKESP